MNLHADVTDWLHLIRAEYAEMPGLHLTKPQMCRLWGLDAFTCETIVTALLEQGFLRPTMRGAYVLGRAYS